MDLVEYFDGSRTPVELWGFVEQLPRNSRYWAARSQDVELHRASVRRGLRARKAPPPEVYEYSPELECLAALFHQLQQIGHLISQQNAKRGHRKRFKPVMWPVPRTAADVVRREDSRRAFETVESSIRFVPVDEYEALTADGARRDSTTWISTDDPTRGS